MAVPVALNIFDTGPRLWMSQYVDGEWITERKVYDRDDGLGVYAFEFGAGATVIGQAEKMGIVINDGPDGPYFLGNGTTDPAPPSIPDEYTDPHPGIWNHVNGARWINGAYYFFGRRDASFQRRWLRAQRSTDDGVTWSEQDAANAPVISPVLSNATLLPTIHDSYWDGADSVYCLASVKESAEATEISGQVFKFDTSTNTWSTATDPFSGIANLPTSREHIEGYLVVHSNGDIGVVYPGDGLDIHGDDINGGIKYRLWSGSAWSAEVAVAAAGAACGTVIFDPSTGTIYLFYYLDWINEGVDSSDPAVLSITKAGTVSSDLFSFPNVVRSDGFGHGIIWGDLMMVPYDDYADASNAIWTWDMTGPVTFTKALLPVPAEEGSTGVPSCASLYVGPAPASAPPAIPVGANNGMVVMQEPPKRRIRHAPPRIKHT